MSTSLTSRLMAVSLFSIAALTQVWGAVDPGENLPRSESVPGGVRIIALPGPASIAPVATFAQHRVMVVRRKDQWLAIVGIGLDA